MRSLNASAWSSVRWASASSRWRRKRTPTMSGTSRCKIGRPPSILSGEALIFPVHEVLAVGPLEPTDDEVAAGHVLKVLDERVIHGGASQRADHRDSLRRRFLRHYHAEARRDLRDEANEDRATFLDDTALGDEARGLRHAFCEHAAHRVVPALGRVAGPRPPAQGEDLDAGERRF